MKKATLLFLVISSFLAKAQTGIQFNAPNPGVSHSDSVRYIYPGKYGGFDWLYNAFTIQHLFLKKTDTAGFFFRKSNNLSESASFPQLRTNIGLGDGSGVTFGSVSLQSLTHDASPATSYLHLDGTGKITSRFPSEVLSDIGGEAALATKKTVGNRYILASGQSNTYGGNTDVGTAGNDTTSNSKVLAWNGTAWVVAKVGVSPLSCITPFILNTAPYDKAVGASFFFAKNLQKATGDTIRLYQMAWNGQPISQWTGTGTSAPYWHYIDSVVSHSIGTNKIEVILWQQGENDYLLSSTYAASFNTLLSQIHRSSWANKASPVIIGAIVPIAGRINIINVQKAIAQNDSVYVRYSFMDDIPLTSRWINAPPYHWSASAQQVLGDRMFSDYVNITRYINRLYPNGILGGQAIIGGGQASDSLVVKNYPGASPNNTFVFSPNGLTVGAGTPFGLSGSFQQYGIYIDPASAINACFVANPTLIATAADNVNMVYGVNGSPVIEGTNTKNWTRVQGSLEGLLTVPSIAANPNIFTVNQIVGEQISIRNLSSTATLTHAVGIAINNIATGTITNTVHIVIGNNGGTVPSVNGNWNTYFANAYNNYLGTGHTLINTTTDDGINAVQVNGGILANKLSVSTSANQGAGSTTLVAGSVTVSNTSVTAGSIILLTRQTPGGTVGTLSYTVSAGTSFTINSSSGTDISTIGYIIIN